jgi:hypothetical protein
MKTAEDRIADFCLMMVALAIKSGLTWREGVIAARAQVLIIEAIDKDALVNDEELEAVALKFIREELAK